jgi:hypothetical protein
MLRVLQLSSPLCCRAVLLQAQRLAQQIPGAELKLYEAEGHLSLLFNQAEDIMASLAAALQQ